MWVVRFVQWLDNLTANDHQPLHAKSSLSSADGRRGLMIWVWERCLAPFCVSLMTDNDSLTTYSGHDQHTHYQLFMTSYCQITLMPANHSGENLALSRCWVLVPHPSKRCVVNVHLKCQMCNCEPGILKKIVRSVFGYSDCILCANFVYHSPFFTPYSLYHTLFFL